VICTRADWSGSEGWEDLGVVTLSAKGIVHPGIGFVKRQTTTCCVFFLGQSQYVDFISQEPDLQSGFAGQP
jgi:hypothetical protein